MRTYRGARTTKPAFEVKLKVEGSIGENNNNKKYYFSSTRRTSAREPRETASLLAQALLCFPLKLGCALPPLKMVVSGGLTGRVRTLL